MKWSSQIVHTRQAPISPDCFFHRERSPTPSSSIICNSSPFGQPTGILQISTHKVSASSKILCPSISCVNTQWFTDSQIPTTMLSFLLFAWICPNYRKSYLHVNLVICVVCTKGYISLMEKQSALCILLSVSYP